MCVCVYGCMCDVSGVLRYGSRCSVVDACMRACVFMCACVYACISDVYYVLPVL